VDREREIVLRGLEKAAEFARTYRFEMTEDYLRLIAHVEALPVNQHGADKSGRWLGGRRNWSSIVRAGRSDRSP
jgi:hypothetical protein